MTGTMRKAVVTGGLAVALMAWSGGAFAQATYDGAKEVYGDMNKAADEMSDAKKNCVTAGKGAATGVLAWKKSRDIGVNEDGWWKKAKLNSLQQKEMELLFKTTYPKFQKAMLDGGKECYNDPRFQKALTEFKGGDKKG